MSQTRNWCITLWFLILEVLSTVGRAEPPPPQPALPLVFMHVTVIDATGAPPQPDMTVVITGDRIAEIGRTQHVRVPDIALFVRFKHHQTWQYPTLTVLRSSAFLDDSTFRNDPRLKYMPAYIRTQWESTTDFRFQARTEDDVALARLVYQKQVELVGIGPPRRLVLRGGSRRSSGAAPTTEALHRKAPVVRMVQ